MLCLCGCLSSALDDDLFGEGKDNPQLFRTKAVFFFFFSRSLFSEKNQNCNKLFHFYLSFRIALCCTRYCCFLKYYILFRSFSEAASCFSWGGFFFFVFNLKLFSFFDDDNNNKLNYEMIMLNIYSIINLVSFILFYFIHRYEC